MSAIVRVIPAGSVQAGLEGVCEDASRRNGILLNGWCTIKPPCLYLQKTMPVYSRSFFRTTDAIRDSDLDCIAPICLDCWSGSLGIDHYGAFSKFVRSFGASFKNEIISTGRCCSWGLLIRVDIVRDP